MSVNAAIPVARGCGTRKKGGIYFETGLSPYGQPLEYFIIDPPILVEDWNLSPVGVQLIERNGVTHIIDWVGSEHYPNVADFLEEIRRFGLSRRLSSSLDFSRIGERTRILLVHVRAWVDNFLEYGSWSCPKEFPGHKPEILNQEPEPDKRMCAGVWWEDIEDGDRPRATRLHGEWEQRDVERRMPSFSYLARQRPEQVKPQYRPAIFASFPCSRLVVVKGNHKTNLDKARKAGVNVAEVDE